MRTESYTNCGHKNTYLDHSYELYWFKKMAAIGPPLESVPSPAMSSWLDLQY